MTERLADISARIDGTRQLSAVVNAMRGIAAARAQQARGQLIAVDSYAATIAVAIGRALTLLPSPIQTARVDLPGRRSCYSAPSRDLPALSVSMSWMQPWRSRRLRTVLDRNQSGAVAAERGITAGWKKPHAIAFTRCTQARRRIAEALYARISMGEIDRLDAVFSQWQPGHGIHVERSRLFPFDMSAFPRSTDANGPLLNLACETLLSELTADYMHAQLCNAALHAFAAETRRAWRRWPQRISRLSASFPHCRRRSGLYDRRRSRRKS